MSGRSTEYSEQQKHEELRGRGWCAFEEMYGPREIARIAQRLLTFVEGLDEKGLAGFGVTVYSLVARDRELRREFHEMGALPFVARALGGSLSLRRTGTRISGRTSQERIIWHHHLGWDEDRLRRRANFERLVCICYLGGTGREQGPLIVLPRAFDDPLQAVPLDPLRPLPEEVELQYPPGTVVVMDAPVLHSARRGSKDGLRVIWGAHCQSSSVALAHPEDDGRVERARVFLRQKCYDLGLRKPKAWLRGIDLGAVRARSSY